MYASVACEGVFSVPIDFTVSTVSHNSRIKLNGALMQYFY